MSWLTVCGRDRSGNLCGVNRDPETDDVVAAVLLASECETADRPVWELLIGSEMDRSGVDDRELRSMAARRANTEESI